MLRAFSSNWALFIGIGLIMVGNGLQGSLLGVRATLESFDSTATGLIMSAFYVGFLFGSALTPAIVRSVGHIRVFTAWASLASAAVLLHGVFVDPWVWVVMRFVTGFAYAGMYVVAESWLNERAENEDRGSVMSLYMVVQYAGLASGQILLNVGDPGGYILFIVVSVLVSLALVPIALSSAPAPLFEGGERVQLRDLLRLTPLGLVSCVVAGATTGVLLGMGAVFAQSVGFTVRETSAFMVTVIIGGVLFQIPLGRISDRVSRRGVIIAVNIIAAFVAFGAAWTSGHSMIIAVGLLVGGFSLPLYGLALAHANDDLKPEQMVAASSALVLSFGLGAALGPITVSFALNAFEKAGFFGMLATLHGLLAVYGLYRTTRRAAIPLEDRGEFLPTPFSVTVAPEAMDAMESTDDHDVSL